MADRGTLYVVATPIGNLEDLTRRAERLLGEVSRVLAEDTRRTRGLLSHLGITGTPIDRFDEHATPRDVERALSHLEGGESLALVSDAGTPAVSDPGSLLVRAAREKGFVVVPVPGASAVLGAIVGSGVAGPFRFVGFLPRQGPERDEALAAIVRAREATVFFEAPPRLGETLRELSLRAPDRRATVARELTKIHEEFAGGTLAELAAITREWLGEITVVVEADTGAANETVDEATVDRFVDEALATGVPTKKAAEIVAARTGQPRREIYARILARRQS